MSNTLQFYTILNNSFKQKLHFTTGKPILKVGFLGLSGTSCMTGTNEINVILLNSTQLLCVVSQNELNHKAPEAKVKVLRWVYQNH